MPEGADAAPLIPREILRKVRRIEIRTNRVVNESLAGRYSSVFRGRGMEFSEVREYQVGDDVRSIDWNVTSRMGHPYIKKHVEERELTVMLAVDCSASDRFGTAGQSKGEIAAEVAALIAFTAIKNNDRVGLLLFTDQVELFVPPAKGVEHVLRVVREILIFRPRHTGTSLALGPSFDVEPFIWTEIFTGHEQPLRNRFSAGALLKLTENVGLELSYVRQDTRGREAINVLKTGLQFSF